MPLAEGQIFGGYTILRHLGSGGMGEIYLAQHPRLPRQDAMKVLAKDVSNDDEYRLRFCREADIAATLWHPHIVGVHDRGDVDGQLWISMDYVEGTDAANLLEERYPNGMPPEEVVKIIRGVGEALDYAHQRQLLHRDVKPSNILIAHPDTSEERALLADFGIARRVDEAVQLTNTNMTVGTVAYAAPEQLMGEPLDGRADQYALAATAFHLLTGAPLFQHSNPAVVISQHLTADPPPIGTRRPGLDDLGPVFSKALSKSREDRYDTCTEFADALANRLGTVAAKSGATDATVSSPVARAKHRSRPREQKAAARPRVRPGVVIAVVLGLSLIAASVIAFLLLSRDKLPVVVIGADCAETQLGHVAQDSSGKKAFCARGPSTGTAMWAYETSVKAPTVTTPSHTLEPDDIVEQVKYCMEHTQQTWDQCREAIRKAPNEHGSQ